MSLKLEEFELILNNAPNLIWRAGTDTKCDYFNKTWLDFTGKSMNEEVGNGWANGVHPDDLDRCIKIYLNAFSKQEAFEMDYRLLRYDGEYRIINDRGVPYYDKNDIFLGYIGSCLDVTEKIEGEMLKEMAIKDGLTGLFDRQYLIKLLKKAISQIKSEDTCISLIMIDIDKFKRFNDNYGHNFGDKVIIETANIIKSSVRDNDSIGRYGGDEFIILLPNTDLNNAIDVGERLCENLSKNLLQYNGYYINIEVSIGISEFKNQNDYRKMIGKVDELMYQSKIFKGNHISY